MTGFVILIPIFVPVCAEGHLFSVFDSIHLLLEKSDQMLKMSDIVSGCQNSLLIELY